jgi:hypothetical protein
VSCDNCIILVFYSQLIIRRNRVQVAFIIRTSKIDRGNWASANVGYVVLAKDGAKAKDDKRVESVIGKEGVGRVSLVKKRWTNG